MNKDRKKIIDLDIPDHQLKIIAQAQNQIWLMNTKNIVLKSIKQSQETISELVNTSCDPFNKFQSKHTYYTKI